MAKRLNVGSIGIFPCFSRHGVQGVEVCCHAGYLSAFVQLEPDIESDSRVCCG